MKPTLRARLESIARGEAPPRRGNVLPEARLTENRDVSMAICELISSGSDDADASRLAPPPELLTILP